MSSHEASRDDPRPRQRVHRAVAFLDLAGFTALTQVHGDDCAADVHEQFLRYIDTACRHADTVACVKHLGDGALLVASSAQVLVGALQDALLRDSQQLALRLRIGLHEGALVQLESEHGTDYLGHTVNIAARLAAHAAPSELLITGEALPPHADGFRHRGALQLRHILEPIDTWSLLLDDGLQHLDPVCQMLVGPEGIQVERDGAAVWVCSEGCLARL